MRPGDVADPLLPPTSGVSITTATSPKRLQAFQHLPSLPMNTQETKTESPAEAAAAIAAYIRPFVCNDCSTACHRTCSSLSRDAANTVTSTGHWSSLGTLQPLHLHPPTLFQAVLLLNQNTIKAGTH